MAISSEKFRVNLQLKEEEQEKKTKNIERSREMRTLLKAEREAKLQENRLIRRKKQDN